MALNLKIRPKLRRQLVTGGALGALGVGIIAIPQLAAIPALYAITGALDVARHKPPYRQVAKKYFLGNGALTWVLSPLNLALDLICYKNHKVYTIEQLPQPCQDEINSILKLFDENKDIVISQFQNHKKPRNMLFYKWYGLNFNKKIPAFHQEFNYVRTIGVSVFQPHTKTSLHFGPVRASLRVLYNFMPADDPNAFIQVGQHHSAWSENPLFIFDDTLLHASENNTDQVRYCAFIDILRPSPLLPVISATHALIGFIAKNSRGQFYRNWKLIDDDE